MILYAIVLLVMGIFVSYIALGCMKEVIDTRLRKDVVELEGEVVDFAKVPNARLTGYLTCPVILFSYNGGGKQEIAAAGNARVVNKYKLNQKVIICYNKDPALIEKRIVIKNDYKDIWELVSYSLVALYFFGTGIWMAYYGMLEIM
ncbi:MAG: hypothetical protein HDT39_06710 [Lachnospiraceae bacterium]|nr:hypothetical protein [Lachnospiraceae bacterium]